MSNSQSIVGPTSVALPCQFDCESLGVWILFSEKQMKCQIKATLQQFPGSEPSNRAQEHPLLVKLISSLICWIKLYQLHKILPRTKGTFFYTLINSSQLLLPKLC
ncbi:Hypothetical predicted protein [Scomber scombrus]|uniref:Uncharacterized protein n=1 Tax=Scomber scombrus TaxID=13677 RepID=A0AAV1N224_SCOSC